MFNKCKVIFLLSTFLLFANTSWADELVSVKGGYQLFAPSGSIAGTINGVGQQLDVEDDLNLDDSENVTAEVAFQWGNSRLSFNYLPIEFSGTGTLTVDGTFNGQPFSTSDIVRSELSVDLYDIGYTYYLLNMDDLPTRFQLGLELAVKIADAEVIFDDLTANFTETDSVTVPIPTIGARTRIALADFFGVVGRVGYLEFDGHHFLDAEAQVEFSPLPTVGIYAGYRYFDLKIDDDDLFVETDFSGPFAGALIRF
jgi:outer membrane protein